MFLTLFKLKKEAEFLDKQGLIKEANSRDSKVERISKFLSNLYKLDLPEYLLDRFILARKKYDLYMSKHGARDDWGEDGDYDAYMDSGEQENYGTKTLWQDDDEEENDYVEEGGEQERSFSKPLSEYGQRELIDFESSYLATMLGGETSDRRYFLNLTSSPILDSDGNIIPSSRETNPQGYAIYLIAYPEEMKKPENKNFIKKIGGDFSKISRNQALEILKFYLNSRNREIFPGMCLDLFGQLLQKARGEKVDDEVIDSFTPELARMEIYGEDPESPVNMGNDFSSNGGRMAPMYNYLSKQPFAKDNMGTVKKSLEGYWKRHADRVDESIEKGDFSSLIGGMMGSARKSAEMESKHGYKTRTIYPQVTDLERKLLGGDSYGVMLLNSMKEIASRFGYSIDRDSPDIPEEVKKVIVNSWDFSSLVSSPFASKAKIKTLQSKFSITPNRISIIREVIEEENQKKSSGEEYIPFFVENNEQEIIRQISDLGMLLRFQEFSMKMADQLNLNRASKRLMEKVEKNRKIMEDLSSGKSNSGNLESTAREEELILKYTQNYHTIWIDPNSGELQLKPDNLAKVIANKNRKKDVIREVGINLSEENGKEEMNQEAIEYAIFIGKKYASPMTVSSIDEARSGDEGEGRSRHEQIGDQMTISPDQLAMENIDDQENTEERKFKDLMFDAKARSLFRYLSESSRTAPFLLGFKKAYESGIQSEYDRYLSIVKDMMLRSEGFEGTSTNSLFADDPIRDEEWVDKIESQYDKRILYYEENEDGTTTVIFDDEEGETVINDRPRSQEELAKDDSEKEDQISKRTKRGAEVRMKAMNWMRNFDQETTVEKIDMMSFNEQDPKGSVKNDFGERKIARFIIMDDNFHNNFIEFMKKNQSINPNWAFDEGIPAKPDPARGRGINQTEKTFRLGRLLAYLYYVCGIKSSQLGAMVLEGNTTSILGSYIDIIHKFYKQLSSDDVEISDEEINSSIFIKTQERKTKDGIKIFRDYNMGEEGQKRLMAISNSEGIGDVDNVVYLSSQYFDRAATIQRAYGFGTSGDKAGDGTEGLGYSEKRRKALYLMRLKYLMDAFRLGAAGTAELNSVFQMVGRINDNMISAKSALGEFGSKKARALGKINSIFNDFENKIKEKEDGDEIKSFARDYLALLEKERSDFYKRLNVTQEQFSKIKQFENDLSNYLRNYDIQGKPVQEINAETCLDIYKKYSEYVKQRYGQGTDEYNQNFISEFIDSYQSLSDVDRDDMVLNVEGNLRSASDEFMSQYSKYVNMLEEHIESGLKDISKEIGDADSVVDEVKQDVEIEEDAHAEEVGEIPVQQTNVKTVNAPIRENIQKQIPTPPAPTGDEESDIDSKMKYLLNLQKLYFGKDIAINSNEYKVLSDSGFKLETDEQDPNLASVVGVPDDFYKYWRNKALMERRKMMQNKISSDIDKYTIFGDKEIDYILHEYGF